MGRARIQQGHAALVAPGVPGAQRVDHGINTALPSAMAQSTTWPWPVARALSIAETIPSEHQPAAAEVPRGRSGRPAPAAEQIRF